jgi:hypothetical protein
LNKALHWTGIPLRCTPASELRRYARKGKLVSKNLDEYISYYLDRLEVPQAANAFHSLIEAPKEAVPSLVEVYYNKTRSSKRAVIFEITCQFRDPKIVFRSC